MRDIMKSTIFAFSLLLLCSPAFANGDDPDPNTAPCPKGQIRINGECISNEFVPIDGTGPIDCESEKGLGWETLHDVFGNYAGCNCYDPTYCAEDEEDGTTEPPDTCVGDNDVCRDDWNDACIEQLDELTEEYQECMEDAEETEEDTCTGPTSALAENLCKHGGRWADGSDYSPDDICPAGVPITSDSVGLHLPHDAFGGLPVSIPKHQHDCLSACTDTWRTLVQGSSLDIQWTLLKFSPLKGPGGYGPEVKSEVLPNKLPGESFDAYCERVLDGMKETCLEDYLEDYAIEEARCDGELQRVEDLTTYMPPDLRLMTLYMEAGLK